MAVEHRVDQANTTSKEWPGGGEGGACGRSAWEGQEQQKQGGCVKLWVGDTCVCTGGAGSVSRKQNSSCSNSSSRTQ
jgi:hypothetical protein